MSIFKEPDPDTYLSSAQRCQRTTRSNKACIASGSAALCQLVVIGACQVSILLSF
ncbi:hypothetical protein CPB83DRAFT_856544 [Crepidotus variabilis]|uniref:Uncharacterized protein n=1 Tax=Crepidotus variabilis TaxID=179855 RepID=A0A9P6EE00_9AGAR|nr:hypothetical protein CPB83DRAFT_856544 [Crepidotus variabilis]